MNSYKLVKLMYIIIKLDLIIKNRFVFETILIMPNQYISIINKWRLLTRALK